ncbi:MAG: TolC family protein [Bacteroidia bacterium]|jgi:outer membrane protein, heavy metal efflux system|nr:TolC family protein [Bacteroidia bacterium]MBP7244880.1 TolC family protein [Bacteroidia bacterium]
MRHKIIITKFLSLVICTSVNAQSAIDNVLAEINKNNKTILATAQYYQAQNLEFKTGLNPSNPTAEYDFLKGSPANAGNQHDFTITQQLDFPSAYIKRSQLAKTQIARSEYEIIANRQDILLEAKKVCIALIYHNKLQEQLITQKHNFEKLLSSVQTKLEKGDGNILEMNKAKLQLIQIKKKFQENVSAINELNIKLSELNGGIEIVFTDTVYFSPTSIPDFAQLEKDYEKLDPLLKMLQQQKLISQKQLELSKSLSLPKMELGYHYQGILGQTYSGFHTGISVPLWENKNSVKQKKSQLLYSESQLIAHTNEHYFHIKHIYERYTNLKTTLLEYQSIFTTLNNTALLNKALALGEITTMQYLVEMNFYTEAQTDFIQTEKEYHDTIAELYKYLL